MSDKVVVAVRVRPLLDEARPRDVCVTCLRYSRLLEGILSNVVKRGAQRHSYGRGCWEHPLVEGHDEVWGALDEGVRVEGR